MAVPSGSVNGLDRARRSRGADWGAGVVGTLAVVSVPLSLGLLAFAPLGSQATRLGLAAAAVGSVLGGLLYAALSRARLPAAGPSSATALVLAALVQALAADGAVLDGSSTGALRVVAGCSLALSLSGALQIVLARAGLARLARLVPRPVLGGFMNGVALLIAISQVPLLLGLAPGTPVANWLASLQPLALLLGLPTLALVLALERWWPRWPALLVALVAGTALHLLVTTQWPGAAMGQRIGDVSAPWPDLPAMLALASGQGLEVLWPHAPRIVTTAAVLALIGSLESLLGLLALDEQLAARHDPRRELQALGLVNLVCGLLGALPTVVLRARASAIMRAGAASAGAAMAGSLSMALLFYVATPLLGLLPMPVLGGIMVAIAVSLVDRWAGGLLLRWWRGEDSDELRTGLAVMAAVCVVTLWQGFAAGVALGVLLSMLVFIVRMNRSLLRAEFSAADRPSRRFYPAPLETRLRPLRPLVRVWELEGALFFGNADRLVAMADAWPAAQRALVLDLRRVSSIDETGAAALAKVASVLQRRHVLVLASGAAEGSAADRALRAFRVALPRQPDIDRATEAAETHVLGDDAGGTLMDVPLAGSDLLRGLDEDQRQQVISRMTPRRLAPGDALFRQGDPADGLYVLTQGSISLIGTDRGVSQRFLSVSPGMMLGETAMLDGGGRSADAVADTAVVLHHLSTGSLHELGLAHAATALQLHRNIAVYLSGRLRAASAAWWSGQV